MTVTQLKNILNQFPPGLDIKIYNGKKVLKDLEINDLITEERDEETVLIIQTK